MRLTRSSLKYELIQPDGYYYGAFQQNEMDMFCTGLLGCDNDKGEIKFRYRKKPTWEEDVLHYPINDIAQELIKEFQSRLRTKGVATFFLNKKEVKDIRKFSRFLVTSYPRSKKHKCIMTCTSDGKSIKLHYTFDHDSKERSWKDNALDIIELGPRLLSDKPDKKFSFELDMFHLRYLRNDDLLVRVGENGLVSFTSGRYNEDVHLQSLSLSVKNN